jgi:NADH:ubiquinone oxidoreductase subunit 3 (subunit A)
MNDIMGIAILIFIVLCMLITILLMCAFILSSRLSRIEEQDWESKEYKK